MSIENKAVMCYNLLVEGVLYNSVTAYKTPVRLQSDGDFLCNLLGICVTEKLETKALYIPLKMLCFIEFSKVFRYNIRVMRRFSHSS